MIFILQVPCVDRLGRRPLLLIPMCIMAVSTVGAFVSVLLIKMNVAPNWFPYLAIVFVALFIVGFAPGLGNLTGVNFSFYCQYLCE